MDSETITDCLLGSTQKNIAEILRASSNTLSHDIEKEHDVVFGDCLKAEQSVEDQMANLAKDKEKYEEITAQYNADRLAQVKDMIGKKAALEQRHKHLVDKLKNAGLTVDEFRTKLQQHNEMKSENAELKAQLTAINTPN